MRWVLVEAPGTAPGSEWFIATAIYFHSRRAGTHNVGRKSPGKKYRNERGVRETRPDGEIDALRRIPAGVSSAAVGLLIAVVFKMMTPLVGKRDAAGLLITAAVFVAIGLLRWPLQSVLLVAIPLSLGITFLVRRRVNA